MHRQSLFGGEAGWHEKDWTASDDRVRGGKSQSYLIRSADDAIFYGTLDITALGGAAGFASQRTTGDDRIWDLSAYDGIELVVAEADNKQYTFILKDELLPPDSENGREQSTVSYEYDFRSPVKTADTKVVIVVPWTSFKATYRGKEKTDAPALNTRRIKRVSLMVRSFFGTQEGDFRMMLHSIDAVTTKPTSPSVANL